MTQLDMTCTDNKSTNEIIAESFNIGPDDAGIRIDSYLAKIYEGRSRNYFQKIIESGNVSINDNQSIKKSHVVELGDVVRVCLPPAEQIDIKPENIPIDICYEDDDLLVVNKPKGMVVHPSAGHLNGTLVNAVLFHCGDSLSGINGRIRPGIVHRIDKNTTGAIIICKNDMSHTQIAAQLKDHSAGRVYKAIVCGHMKDTEGIIDAPIGRSFRDRKKMAVVYDGKPAITHYKVLKEFKNYSYCEFKLETGRTHQIRVHMAYAGHAIMGDDVYGKALKGIDGQVLHAEHVRFVHPRTGIQMDVKAPIPPYFIEILEKLEKTC